MSNVDITTLPGLFSDEVAQGPFRVTAVRENLSEVEVGSVWQFARQHFTNDEEDFTEAVVWNADGERFCGATGLELVDPAPAVKVGDRVRVTVPAPWNSGPHYAQVGEVGVLVEVDTSALGDVADAAYHVDLGADRVKWAQEVELVDPVADLQQALDNANAHSGDTSLTLDEAREQIVAILARVRA